MEPQNNPQQAMALTLGGTRWIITLIGKWLRA